VGRFKSQVLAERLARRFGREIGYSVLPYDHQVHAEVFGHAPSRLALLVGAVDNAAARWAIAQTLDEHRWSGGPAPARPRIWWLDAGNGRNSGVPSAGVCRALPAPSLQRPDLLDAPPAPEPQPQPPMDCAQAVARGDQGPTINAVVAAIAASYVEKLLAGTCHWMASYFDLDDGTLRCLPADPKTVASIAGLHPNAVAPSTKSA
jgi:hypothetical protein